MSKKIFNILDDIFAHDNYAVAGRESEFITWDRQLTNKSNPTFYSHHRISQIQNNNTLTSNSYGLMFESRGIVGGTYSSIEKFINKFNKFFTHNSEFLNKYDNCYWIPGGGIWVGGTYGKGKIGITEKSKICSFTSSRKQMCDLHRLRLQIATSLNHPNVDVFGIGGWVPIYQTLNEYMFSIVIENFIDDLYFTEKLLNCFATGTIPIYLGAKNISEKFDADGIITFNNINELKNILPTLSKELYESKLSHIKTNHDLCKKYKSLEDYIFINYFNNG